MRQINGAARLHLEDPLAAPCGSADDAKERHTDTEMGKRRAPSGAWQAYGAPQRRAERNAQNHGALGDIRHSASHDKNGDADSERRQHRSAMFERKRRRNRNRRDHGSRQQTLRRAKQIAALPAEQRSERHHQHQRNEQRAECRIKERRPNRNLIAGQRFQRERIKRADENGGAGRGQEQIVEDQRTLP